MKVVRSAQVQGGHLFKFSIDLATRNANAKAGMQCWNEKVVSYSCITYTVWGTLSSDRLSYVTTPAAENYTTCAADDFYTREDHEPAEREHNNAFREVVALLLYGGRIYRERTVYYLLGWSERLIQRECKLRAFLASSEKEEALSARLSGKPYPPDCQYYIVCTGRNAYRLTKCLLGRHFSPLQEECINPTTALCPTCFVTATSTPSNATSTTADITTITEVQTTTMGYISTTVDITTTTTLEPTTTTTTTLEPTTSSPVVPTCPPTPTCGTFDDGIKKPYPPNCSQYILCQTMQEVITDCQDGEHFSPTSKKCILVHYHWKIRIDKIYDFIENGYICLLLAVLASTPPTFTNPVAECPPLYECTISDVRDAKPYPPDCTKYIECTGRNTYEIKTCLWGRHFSPTSETCVDPSTAGCSTCFVTSFSTPSTTVEITTTEVKTTEFISTTVEITTTTTTLEPTTSSPVVPTCPPTPTCGTFDDGLKKPYPPNCSQYILCQTMQEVIKDCPDGEHFNPTSKKCEH
ncbi:hypothetical protein B566_EDAN012156 [Ephemera danica]|nr:hypothetical protein B566_EDAN012156 [Ephemera danica]